MGEKEANAEKIRTGCRPRRGDGRDPHLPAGLGQSGADPPVIDVAAGGLAGIVESLGRYDVDPHDALALQSVLPVTAYVTP